MSLVVKIAARRTIALPLVRYLANNSGLHQNQRMVAGSVKFPGRLDDQLVQQVADDLEFNQRLTGAVSSKGHIYHVSLSASADNGQLSDARWSDIANDFMKQMRFTGPNLSPIRWTAVNHGVNGGGADHIHIVMSTIRENGKQVSLHNDMIRASAVATKLEQKYGVGVLASRLTPVGAGSIPYSHAEVRRAKESGRPEPDRVRLERDIRALAMQARSEAEFVKLVRDDGLSINPFPASNGLVTGYSVAMPVGVGNRQDWFAGGKLAKDLTLPQLRRRWEMTPNQRVAAQHAWRGSHAVEEQLDTPDETVDLDALAEALAAPTPADLAELSHDLAAHLATASRELESTPGDLAAASREVGAWAQPTVMPTGEPLLTRAGARLFVLSLDPSGERGRSIMFRQFAETMFELYRLHQVSRLRAATRGQVNAMPDDANPAEEFIGDGTTLVATGAMLGVMQHAQQQRQEQQEQARQEQERTTPDGGDGATVNGGTEVFGARNQTRPDGSTDLIDRSFFTDVRMQERARREQIREHGRQMRAGMPNTPEGWKARQENIEHLGRLADQVGLPIDTETLQTVPDSRLREMRLDFEEAARDYGFPPVQQGQYEAVASQVVGPHGVQNGAQADAFLLGLERKAELREQARRMAEDVEHRATEAPWIDPDHMVEASPEQVADMRAELGAVTDCAPLLADHQVVELNQKMHAAGVHPTPVAKESIQQDWQRDPKDPRNWDNAQEPISPKQLYRLAEAELSAQEIQELAGKGEASVVVGAYLGTETPPVADPARARMAYDKVMAERPGATVTPGARSVATTSEATTPAATAQATPKATPKLRPKQ